MLLHVEYGNGLAVYDQIVRQVKFAIAGGAVEPGELVPSVREVARELAVNPNTVARAYRLLQEQRILEPVPGTGLAVATTARRQCRAERTKLIRERIQQALAEAQHSGLDAAEILRLVETELHSVQRRGRRSINSEGEKGSP